MTGDRFIPPSGPHIKSLMRERHIVEEEDGPRELYTMRDKALDAAFQGICVYPEDAWVMVKRERCKAYAPSTNDRCGGLANAEGLCAVHATEWQRERWRAEAEAEHLYVRGNLMTPKEESWTDVWINVAECLP